MLPTWAAAASAWALESIRVYAQRKAAAQRVDLGDHIFGVTGIPSAPAHHLQHGAKDFGLHMGNAFHFKGVRGNQIRDHCCY